MTYAVDPELFCRESVEVFAPDVQLPSDCESVRDTAVGQSTVLPVSYTHLTLPTMQVV